MIYVKKEFLSLSVLLLQWLGAFWRNSTKRRWKRDIQY